MTNLVGAAVEGNWGAMHPIDKGVITEVDGDTVWVRWEYERVTFTKGDSMQISDFDTENLLHPWLIVEDAHVNVNEVITYFEQHMHTGDYMIIEDSWGKKGSKLEIPNTLQVDAYYCDYFGLNATSAMNTILRKE